MEIRIEISDGLRVLVISKKNTLDLFVNIDISYTNKNCTNFQNNCMQIIKILLVL